MGKKQLSWGRGECTGNVVSSTIQTRHYLGKKPWTSHPTNYKLNRITQISSQNICNVNMGGWRDIYDSIAPKPRIFSSEVQKCPRARPADRGHFLTEDEKIRGWVGYTVVYSPTTPHICNICTTSGYLSHFQT